MIDSDRRPVSNRRPLLRSQIGIHGRRSESYIYIYPPSQCVDQIW